MGNQFKRKRINYSIKPRMQIRLFMKVFVIAVVVAGLMAAIFYFYSNRQIENYRQFHIQAKNFLDYLEPAVFISLLLALVVAVGITIFFPIRIAGPLFRIERDLKEKVGEGDLSIRFKLRKGDEVWDLANAINDSLDKLCRKIAVVKKSAEELDTIVTGKDKEVEKLVKKVNDGLREFKI